MGFLGMKEFRNWRVARISFLQSLFTEQGRDRELQAGPAIRTEKESNLVPMREKDLVVSIDKMYSKSATN